MLEHQLVNLLKEKNLTIGSIESITGGLFASTLTNVSGVSQVFPGSIVTYANEAKEQLLGISHARIENYGVVSKEIAYDMAKEGKNKLHVDICVSFTGNAGPTALDHLPVGRLFIGIAIGQVVKTYELQINALDRNRIRELAVDEAMKKVIELVRQQETGEGNSDLHANQ